MKLPAVAESVLSKLCRPQGFLFCAIVAGMLPAASAAYALDPETDPRLARYREFVDKAVPSTIQMNAAAFESCTDCEPFVIYCTRPIRAIGDLKGLTVRARHEAAKFFSTHTGKVAVLLPASEIGAALQYSIIDCIGFGGGTPETGVPPAAGQGVPGGSLNDDFSSF